jgi:parallel beta-helix repeat protein
MQRALLTIGIILIFLLSNISISLSIKPNDDPFLFNIKADIPNSSLQNHYPVNNGSLSGYVTDQFLNPIQEANIRITCGGFFLQDFSNSTGYYRIGNVPIVDCYWNVSASKKGYQTSMLEMSIDISTHDFVLQPISDVFVDDDAPRDWYDATHVKTIQEGIDNATYGDSILIYSGHYDENIVVSKQVRLEGVDKKTTIISSSNPSEYLIMNSVNFTTISNLTLNCSQTERHNIIRIINCSQCSIHHIDLFSDSLQRSALVVNGSDNIISQIRINGRFIFSGIELFYTHRNSITHNSINASGAGILIHRSHQNTIASNTLTNNTNGIYIEEGNQNAITKNILKNNNRGVFSSYSTKNIMEKNNFIGNDEQAKFTKLFRRGFLSPNNWRNNYWDDWNGIFIRPIPGVFYIPNGLLFGLFIPWFTFDVNPTSEPFDILS